MGVVGTILSCSLVGLIWGTTNVLIKRSTQNIPAVKKSSWKDRLIDDLRSIWLNPTWLFFLCANQIGSVFFYFLLVNSELSLVVPITNSLTFLFTAATSIALGERVPSTRAVVGTVAVLAGITCCILDKLRTY